MSLSKLRLIIPLLLSLGAQIFAAYPDQAIPTGLSIVSPDGRYFVRLTEIEGQSRYLIKNTQTAQEDKSILMPTVLLYLHWAPNSRSIVTVEHVPKGSCGRVIYLQNAKWRNLEVRPPGERAMNSAVVSLEIKSDHVHYSFAVRNIESNGMPIDYKLCDLDVNLEIGQVFNVNWRPVRQAEFETILARKPSYAPPME